MKNLKLNAITAALLMFVTVACTNNNRTGSNMSEEGTTQTNRVNSEMEDNRTPSDVDTILSPGSNALDHKNRDADGAVKSPATDNSNTSPSVSSGGAKDHNMAGQSDTHGKSTTAGDK